MKKIRVALIGYGKAGKAVAHVLTQDERYQLCWIGKRTAEAGAHMDDHPDIPLIGLNQQDLGQWLDAHPVDALVDFSDASSLQTYGEQVRQRQLMLVSAISAYAEEDLNYLRELGQVTRIISSPNITLGINFLLMSAKLLHSMAPFADIEIVEQHFREKPEVSGTARKLAASLNLNDERITSLRVGGIVGHHEVIFGFPHQTVRLIHDSIRREAFGTGAAFALQELALCPPGFYAFDDLLMRKMRQHIQDKG